jgi:hypothetical protein
VEKVTQKNDVYQIRWQGYLKANWSKWLKSSKVKYKRNGITILTGQVDDQAALQGLLEYLFGMGITILSLKRLDTHLKTGFFHHHFFHLFNFC